MSQTAFTTVTLRRLPQGETLQITISGNRALNILWDKDSHVQTPTLSDSNYFELKANVYGTSGTTATLSNCHWEMSDINLATIAQDGNVSGSTLRIIKSPIASDATSVKSYIIKFTADATLNGHKYKVEKSVTFQCTETSQNSYWGAIESNNGTTFDGKKDDNGDDIPITLTPKLYLGTAETTNDFSVVWYKNNVEIKDSVTKKYVLSGKNLIVYPDGVETAAHFEAHFYVAGNEVEAEGVSIIDLTDEIQVVAAADNAVLQETETATITIKAYSAKTGEQLDITSIDTADVEDSVRQRTIHPDYRTLSVANGVGTIKMQAKHMCVPYYQEGATEQVKGEWAICGDSSSADTMTDDITKATKCDVNIIIGVSVNL